MRTSINIDDHIFHETKQFALDSRTTFTHVIEDALRSLLAKKKAENKDKISLITMKGNGLKHGVDLDDNQSLSNIMDE